MSRAATHERTRLMVRWWVRRRPALALALAVAAAAGFVAAASGATTGPQLTGISARTNARSTSVLIEATEPVAYSTSRPDPLTILVSLRHVSATGAANRVPDGVQGVVSAVTVEEATEEDGATAAQVRLSLVQPARHTVRSARNVIEVELDQPAAPLDAAMTSAPPDPVIVTAPGAVGSATVLQAITTSAAGERVQVTLSGDGRLAGTATELASTSGNRLVLDFSGVKSAVPAVTTVAQGPVQRVRVGAYREQPVVTRVVFDLTEPVRYRLEAAGDGGRDLRVIFDGRAAAEAPPTPSAPMGPTPTSPSASGGGVVSVDPMAALKVAPGAPAQTQAQAAAPASPAPSSSPQAASSSPQAKRYTGQPVSLDFQGLDLRAVLRVFAEISGLNIVIDPAVQGTVDVALREVPWDQALEIILRANKLGYSVEGTIIRIAPLNVLADEEAQRRKLLEEQALSGELKTLAKQLSYAKGDEIRPLLEKSGLLSKRGTVQFDPRTNMLIIRDLPDQLTLVSDLISTLDRPELQVEIEARIVRTTSEYARALGVQWSFSGRMSPFLGNTTGLAFPNTVGGGGGVTLPAASVNDVTSSVNLSLGAVNGALNLDVALSALEKDGKARVLLQPRVVMQNNVEGYIMRGQQIPYTTAQAGSVIGGSSALLTPATVQFKDAALSLKVTPQVTAAGTIFMKIDVENSFPNYAVTRAEQPNPAIDTQKASTRVLVPDGATTVIGGIYETSEDETRNTTPGLSRIPLFGWLFRNEDKTTQNNELLIFITPRIIRVQ